jgi:polyferredoxin
MQTTLASFGRRISLYATGLVVLIGALGGRFVCGWLCPFGLFQELLYKIPSPKRRHSKTPSGTPIPKTPLRYLKYVILLLFVFLLPALVRNDVGLGETWFCEYICPAGTVEAALPLLLTNEGLRQVIGWRFWWKLTIAVGIVLFSMYENRPFCKYLCPLGAIYGACNKISFFRLKVDDSVCTRCGACMTVCGMGLDPVSELDSAECIRCGACKDICPVHAITWTHSITVECPESVPGGHDSSL